MSRTIKYRQFINLGVDHVVIMPIYGSVAFNKMKDLGLPMRIDREPNETRRHFDDRIKLQHLKILKKIGDQSNRQTWTKIVMAKPHIIDHDYNPARRRL